jgi:hypothetical protein
MKHKYYYTYKVQCTAVGWEDYYYLGQHTTNNLDDGYKGSGKRLHEYYKQYPNDYTFTILEFYSNKTELNIAEQKLIGDLWKTDPYCLNLIYGGHGSWAVVNKLKRGKPSWNRGKKLSEEHKQKVSISLKGKHHSIETKHKISESNKNKQRSEETKKKLSESHKGKKCPTKGKHRVYRDDGTFYMSF